jgi:hypothetical protein
VTTVGSALWWLGWVVALVAPPLLLGELQVRYPRARWPFVACIALLWVLVVLRARGGWIDALALVVVGAVVVVGVAGHLRARRRPAPPQEGAPTYVPRRVGEGLPAGPAGYAPRRVSPRPSA